MKRKPWVLAGAAVLIAVAATGGVAVMSGAKEATPAAAESPANTVQVERGKLSAMVSLDGILTYRARSDGSPYSAINRASGTYTELPDVGDKVGCGDVLYRVDDDPVLLLCGTVPAYRDLDSGDEGKDVRQLNRNLHELGYDADPEDNSFTWKTDEALEKLQDDKGYDETGALDLDDAIFLPKPARSASFACASRSKSGKGTSGRASNPTRGSGSISRSSSIIPSSTAMSSARQWISRQRPS